MKWTDYTTKETLEDNDELMILDKDANANKRTLMDKVWNYIVDKMTTAVIAKLETTNKTLIGAVNELNSNALKGSILNHVYENSNINTMSVDVSDTSSNGNAIPFILFLADWSTGNLGMVVGVYRGSSTPQQPYIHSDVKQWAHSVTCDGKTLAITFAQTSYCRLLY